jgi:hypothetical protein
MRYNLLIFTFLLFALTSCDYTMRVAIRNHKDPCRVQVSYERSEKIILNNDTLLVGDLYNASFERYILRTNTSAESYYFIAPKHKETVLAPTALGMPIKEVTIINSVDSFWKIDLRDRKVIRKLKKAGKVRTKGFIFKTSIVIENK